MSPQDEASILLQQWQSMRALPPEERIERLFSDFWTVPIESDVRYQDQLNAVMAAMEVA